MCFCVYLIVKRVAAGRPLRNAVATMVHTPRQLLYSDCWQVHRWIIVVVAQRSPCMNMASSIRQPAHLAEASYMSSLLLLWCLAPFRA